MKKILLAAAILLPTAATAQEWTLSTVLGNMSIEALAVAPDGTAWAGQSNSIYRFDGSGWAVVTTVTAWSDVEFFGAVAPANDRAYFSGWGLPPAGGAKASIPTSIYLPIVLRQSGGAGKFLSWWDVGIQVAPWEYSAHLWAVANGSGGYDVWAAAWGGIYKSSDDGAGWVSFTDPGIDYYSDIDGNGTSDIWVAGADSAYHNACLYHYNGSVWSLDTSPFQGSTPKVCLPSGGPPCCAFFSPAGAQVAGYHPGSGWFQLTTIPGHYPLCMTSAPSSSKIWLGTEHSASNTGGIFYSPNAVTWEAQTSLTAPVYALDASYPGVVWAATTGAIYNLGWRPGRRDCRGDYSGDGSSDIAIYRPANGLWAIRGYTRYYFGGAADAIVPGDYSGDGSCDVAIFRQTNGLWAIRGVTRVYFGGSADIPVSADYSGDGSYNPAIFRRSTGLWAIRGVTRCYFGGSADVPVSADYSGDGSCDPAIFRRSTGLWAVRGVTRYYFGGSADIPVSADYSGNGSSDIAIYRQANGLWAIRGYTRCYFGGSADIPVSADYSGNGTESPAIFRNTSGLWAIRGVTRAYFGQQSDIPAVERRWWEY